MRLEQLRFLAQVVDSGFSISRAAQVLRISQPAVSKQIQLLERELRAEILLRRDGRIVGLTTPGQSVLNVARRMINDAANLHRVGDEFANAETGRLTFATTHINARYVLLRVIEQFRHRYPNVQLILRQGTPREIFELVASAQADIGVTSAPPEGTRGLITLPSYVLERSLIAPAGHALMRSHTLTLRDIANHPVITLDRAFAGGAAVLDAFAKRGIELDVVMTATDADVIKAYVELGLGITVLPQVVFDPLRDRQLNARDVSHLFAPTLAVTCIHSNTYLRQYVYDFIEMIAPKWTRDAVNAKLKG
jgi:LysR family cys regulon transcriptional activator